MNIKKIENGNIASPSGFLADGIYAGLKSPGKDKLDLGIVYSERECEWAATYTKNLVLSSSVEYCKNVRSKIQGVIVNSGSANCCVGIQGLTDAQKIADMVKDQMRSEFPFLVSSTGVIGVEIPVGLVQQNVSKFKLSKEGGEKFSRAIITTDSRTKNIGLSVETEEGVFAVGGVAKGSGMIHPRMGTLLSYITTDASVASSLLTKILRDCVDQSFNQIDVDGDTSTNDTVVIMANGESNVGVEEGRNYQVFYEAIMKVCTDLAKMIAEDAEGVTHLITVEVYEAIDDLDARKLAHAVVSSNLVKTAVYGKDPNWGRIMMALGNADAKLDKDLIKIHVNEIQIVEDGKSISFHHESVVSALNNFNVSISISLGLGDGRGMAWGSDLSEEYVIFNSAYTT